MKIRFEYIYYALACTLLIFLRREYCIGADLFRSKNPVVQSLCLGVFFPDIEVSQHYVWDIFFPL